MLKNADDWKESAFFLHAILHSSKLYKQTKTATISAFKGLNRLFKTEKALKNLI
jgi:hypothetical protein